MKMRHLPLLSLLAFAASCARAHTAAPPAPPAAPTITLDAHHPHQRHRITVCTDKHSCTKATLPTQAGNVVAILPHPMIDSTKTHGSFLAFSPHWISLCYVSASTSTTTCAPVTHAQRGRGFSIALATPLPGQQIDARTPLVFTAPRGRQASAADYQAVARSIMGALRRTSAALNEHASGHYLGRASLATLTARPSNTGCERSARVIPICSSGDAAVATPQRASALADDGSDNDPPAASDNSWPDNADPEGLPMPDDSGYPSDNGNPPPPPPLPDGTPVPQVFVTETRPAPAGSGGGPVVDIPYDLMPWDGSFCLRVGRGPMVCAPPPPPILADPEGKLPESQRVYIPGKRLKEIAVAVLQEVIHTPVLDPLGIFDKRPKATINEIYLEMTRQCQTDLDAGVLAAKKLNDSGFLNADNMLQRLAELEGEYVDCIKRAKYARDNAF